MKNKLVVTCITAAVVGTATMSFGAGFKIAEQGAKAMAMGNAFAAQADDPSALAYNPAGIAFLKGAQMQVGTTTIVVPETTFTGATKISRPTTVSEKANQDIFIAPTVYATTSLESMPLSFGLGINSFHPLAKRWDTGSAFRDSIQSISIKPVNIQPTVAYRFDDLNLAVAGGVDVTYAQISMQKAVYNAGLGGDLGSLGVDGDAVGYGYNAGVLWKPTPAVSFALAYRSKIKLGVDGDANYLGLITPTDLPSPYSAIFPARGTTVKSAASADITLPDALTLGVAWKPIEELTLEFDAERTGWSSYDKLDVKFANTTVPGVYANVLNNKPDPKNWKDVWAYRFGAQYAVTPKMDLRAGYAFDKNPAPESTLSPELPDADRHNFSIGSGLHNEYGAIDLAYMWVHWVDRTVDNLKETGTFKSDAHLFAISLTHKF